MSGRGLRGSRTCRAVSGCSPFLRMRYDTGVVCWTSGSFCDSRICRPYQKSFCFSTYSFSPACSANSAPFPRFQINVLESSTLDCQSCSVTPPPPTSSAHGRRVLDTGSRTPNITSHHVSLSPTRRAERPRKSSFWLAPLPTPRGRPQACRVQLAQRYPSASSMNH